MRGSDKDLQRSLITLPFFFKVPLLESPGTSYSSGTPTLLLITVSDSSTFVAVVGPAILAMSYLAISAIFLPGAGSFLTTNFRLNTATMLALSYGWPTPGMYTIISVCLALRPVMEERMEYGPP